MTALANLGRTRSWELVERARQVIPGGVNSNFRKEDGYVPPFITRGSGGRLYDADEREFIDLSLSYGPAILGHGNRALIEATASQLQRLCSNESSELEACAAQKIIDHVPCAGQVRFACSGTEANYFALRAARAHTRRDLILRFNGHYHGGSDELLGGVSTESDGWYAQVGEGTRDYFSQMTNTAGRARAAFHSTLLVEWNCEEIITDIFRDHGSEIAAVLMEPVMVNNFGCLPRPGYLEHVRALCDKYGVVLIFDEVLTGFRMGLGGAQARFNVIPDMATFGKALGGGFPVSAFCGRKEVMEHIARTEVVAGGTYNGHPVMMAAVVATITELERNNGAAFDRIRSTGDALRLGLEALARHYREPLRLQGFPGAWTFSFGGERVRIDNHAEGCDTDLARALRFNKLLREYGVLATQRLCTSCAHTQDDIDIALSRAGQAFAALAGTA